MANTKEIKSKIASVESTKKITSAMEMVATSKMRNAQDAMNQIKPYSDILSRVVSHFAKSITHATNPYIKQRPIKTVCMVVISTDRGLCGGLNGNLFKRVLAAYHDYLTKNYDVKLAVVGSKGVSFFENLELPIVYTLTDLGDRPSAEYCLGFIQGIVKDFLDEKFDLVDVFSNDFINTMTQVPSRKQYLPLPQLPTQEDDLDTGNWDYIYEGDPKVLLTNLVARYVEYCFYSTIVETIACEQVARMFAMKAATDNASSLIDELTLVYNKARQASITNEINEIVAGAAAV